MKDLLDDFAHFNALRETSVRLKLLLGLISIFVCVYSQTPIAPLVVAASMSFITVTIAKIPGRIYLRLLLIPLSFALLSASVVAIMNGNGQILFEANVFGFSLSMHEDGANMAFLLIARTFGGMCSLFFIALTTPMIEIFAVLKVIRVPQTVIDLSMMIYRYIFVFLDQAAMIHNAQVMRLGDAGIKNSIQSFAMLSSVLFLRSWEQGERLIVAMDARCYDGMLDLIEQPTRANAKQISAALAYLAVIMTIAILTKDIYLL